LIVVGIGKIGVLLEEQYVVHHEPAYLRWWMILIAVLAIAFIVEHGLGFWNMATLTTAIASMFIPFSLDYWTREGGQFLILVAAVVAVLAGIMLFAKNLWNIKQTEGQLSRLLKGMMFASFLLMVLANNDFGFYWGWHPFGLADLIAPLVPTLLSAVVVAKYTLPPKKLRNWLAPYLKLIGDPHAPQEKRLHK